jgi:hypothetical protein
MMVRTSYSFTVSSRIDQRESPKETAHSWWSSCHEGVGVLHFFSDLTTSLLFTWTTTKWSGCRLGLLFSSSPTTLTSVDGIKSISRFRRLTAIVWSSPVKWAQSNTEGWSLSPGLRLGSLKVDMSICQGMRRYDKRPEDNSLSSREQARLPRVSCLVHFLSVLFFCTVKRYSTEISQIESRWSSVRVTSYW